LRKYESQDSFARDVTQIDKSSTHKSSQKTYQEVKKSSDVLQEDDSNRESSTNPQIITSFNLDGSIAGGSMKMNDVSYPDHSQTMPTAKLVTANIMPSANLMIAANIMPTANV